jgi:hypothetical protein
MWLAWWGDSERKIFFRGWGEAITWWVIKYPGGYDYRVFLIIKKYTQFQIPMQYHS